MDYTLLPTTMLYDFIHNPSVNSSASLAALEELNNRASKNPPDVAAQKLIANDQILSTQLQSINNAKLVALQKASEAAQARAKADQEQTIENRIRSEIEEIQKDLSSLDQSRNKV
jgi:hypothetical protein